MADDVTDQQFDDAIEAVADLPSQAVPNTANPRHLRALYGLCPAALPEVR